MPTSAAPSLAAAHADANLLFGVLALQMDFVTRDQLIAGMQAWVGEKSTPLADHMVRSGALKPGRRQMLDALVSEHVGHHNGNVPSSIAAIEGIDDIQQDLSRIDDADVRHSAARVASQPAAEMTCVLDNSPSDNMRFRILRPHARGGLGEVFVAKDTELGREVALKEIQLERSDDSEARSRFIREAEITGGLEHPGVVPVYSLGTYPDGRPFYAMRFIRGQTLHDAIKAFHSDQPDAQARDAAGSKSPPPPASDVLPSLARGSKAKVSAEKNLKLRHLLNQFIDVCQAIDYAHSRGVLHRDLKPANIMLGKYGETLVVDWGLAKASGESKARPAQTTGTSGSEAVPFPETPLAPSATHESEATQMGYVPGTPAYMSPEHALGRLDLMGPASDVFSLGATLYHILTGRPPYVGDNANDTQRLAQSGSYPAPGKIASVAAPLAAICCKAMAVSPAERYATAKCLAEDVERYLGDEPVSAYREPLRTRVARWCRRHSRLVATAVIVGLIVPICLGSGLFVALQEKRVAQSAEDRAEVRLIAASSILAHDALLSGDHPAAARALARFPDGRRGWIYEYLHRQLAFDGIVCNEVSTIQCLAMHPAKVRLAYGTQEGVIHLLDPRSGEDKQDFSLPHDLKSRGAVALAYSTTGSQLAVAAGDTVVVYNATALTPVQRVKLPAAVAEMLFSPDNQRVMALLRRGSSQRIVAFNVADGAVAWRALSSDNENLEFALSADGTQLVVAAGSEVSLLQISDGTLSKSWHLPANDEGTALLALANGQLVVGTAAGTAAVYDLESGQPLRALDNVIASVTGAQFKNNAWQDQRASIVSVMGASGSSDIVLLSSAGDVWIVDYETRELRRKLTHKGVLAAAGSSPLLAMSDQDEVFVFDVARALLPIWKEFRIFPGEGRYPALSPDGRLIAYAMDDPAADGEVIVVHDVELNAIKWTAKAQYPHFFRFSRDGRVLAAVCDDLRVFDSDSGSLIMQSPKLAFPNRDKEGQMVWNSPMQVAVVDAANRYVAVDGETVQLWEIASAQKVAESPVLHVRTVRLSASGDAVLGNVHGTIRSWRIPDLKEMGRLAIDQTAASGATWRITTGRLGDLVAVASDNNIVQRSGYRWIATAWPSGKPICSFDHDGECLCFDIHPRCRRVVTGGADGKLNIWQYPSGEKLLELPFSRTVAAVKFANNGTRLIAIDKEGKVGIWDSDPLKVEEQE